MNSQSGLFIEDRWPIIISHPNEYDFLLEFRHIDVKFTSKSAYQFWLAIVLFGVDNYYTLKTMIHRW
jgi:hypothetical protein